MAYASKRIPEIADSIVDIDNAMKWGFAWQMGPFETWDALGVAETLARLEGEGVTVAPWVQEMLDAGHATFYTYHGIERMAYSPLHKQYVPVEQSPKALAISYIKRCHATIAENDEASLIDMGDGVMLLEFHSKMNALGEGIFKIIEVAIDRLHGGATGLVIGNEGDNFSVGANLLAAAVTAQSGQYKELEYFMKSGQDAFMALRTAPAPVVAAPFNLVLGGGVEISLASDRIVAHAETYLGLVEVGVGLIPGWGGTKESVRRMVSPHMHATNVNPMPYLRHVFTNIGMAQVSKSAAEARDMGYLQACDRIVMNKSHLLSEAKREVLHLAESGYRPPTVTGNVYAAGRDALASVKVEIYSMKEAGYISEYDGVIAEKLGNILVGVDLSASAWMDEQYFLDLEREAILSLMGTEKTQARIWHMLQTGKPLRN